MSLQDGESPFARTKSKIPIDLSGKPPSRRSYAEVITPQVDRFLDAMVDDGLHYTAAAKSAGVRLKRARHLLKHPVVLKEYERRCEVLRTSERARNIHKAVSIRDDETLKSPAGRKVQLDAAKYLDGVDGDSTRASGGTTVNVSIVGYVMDLTGPKSGPRVIEHDAGEGVRSDGEA